MSGDVREQLIHFGFQDEHIQRAMDLVNEDNFDKLLEWLLVNPLSDEDKLNFLVRDIVKMGFKEAEAKSAISTVLKGKIGSAEDVKRCLDWLADKDSFERAQLQSQRNLQIEAEQKLDLLKTFQLNPNEVIKNQEKVVVEEIEEDIVRNVCFGGKVCLQNVATNKFLFSENGNTFVYANLEPEMQYNDDFSKYPEDGVFDILSAINQKDVTSKVEREGKPSIALKCSDGNWVAAEVDGRVNTNRSGPVGLFAAWKLRVLDKAPKIIRKKINKAINPFDEEIEEIEEKVEDTSPFLAHLDIVTFESALHNYLHVKKGTDLVVSEIAVSNKPPKRAQWRVYIKDYENDSTRNSSNPDLKVSKKLASVLWRILKSNYRLAALKMRSEEIKHYKEQVEKHRKRVDEASASQLQSECIICWANPRNAVILECGHICLCRDCYENGAIKLNDADNGCPICRKIISKVVIVREN
jgi:hypothetical protein